MKRVAGGGFTVDAFDDDFGQDDSNDFMANPGADIEDDYQFDDDFDAGYDDEDDASADKSGQEMLG